jgi:hypothetical protein
MLARRFTVACLIVSLVGMFLAILVAEASRPALSWDIGAVVPCVFEEGITCAPPKRKGNSADPH